MPMISYAQNREDVLLRRAFPQANGFYIDVGAADPVSDSVTKCFYDAGWSGINVEPLEQFHSRLVADRPRDINLNVVAADRAGEIDFYEVPSCIGWATLDAGTSERYVADGIAVAPRKIEAVTLAQVCERYVRGPIDFLKIDVEGAEAVVLAGADFTRWRPRLLVIEATEVGRPTQNHGAWESRVLEFDYHFAAFDGLNRYYVRSEDRHLAEVLAVPANVFDDYVLAEVVQEREARLQAVQSAESQIAAVQGELAAVQREMELLRRGSAERYSEVAALQRTLAETQTANDITLRILEQTRGHLEVIRSESLHFAA